MMTEWKSVGVRQEVHDEFESRRPDHMTQSEYLAFLLDRSEHEPDIAEAVAQTVIDELRPELSTDRGAIRQAARSGASQALKEHK